VSELPADLTPRRDATPTPAPRVQRAEHGLTAPGVVVIVLAGSLVGLLIDRFTVDSGWIYSVAFIASTVYAALQVRPRDLLSAVIVPPLVFLLLAIGASMLDGTGGGWSDHVLDLVSQLAIGAPALWVATGAAAAIVLVRRHRWARG
jgi:hypothetical protein